MVNVTNGTDVHMRLGAVKFSLAILLCLLGHNVHSLGFDIW